nr:uncharacterized protein CI109_007493 [Kwoniella shandongensis]KAA5524193.1 hypothetical protein CI109_007493 [Kwoniella shandongensis]
MPCHPLYSTVTGCSLISLEGIEFCVRLRTYIQFDLQNLPPHLPFATNLPTTILVNLLHLLTSYPQLDPLNASELLSLNAALTQYEILPNVRPALANHIAKTSEFICGGNIVTRQPIIQILELIRIFQVSQLLNKLLRRLFHDDWKRHLHFHQWTNRDRARVGDRLYKMFQYLVNLKNQVNSVWIEMDPESGIITIYQGQGDVD